MSKAKVYKMEILVIDFEQYGDEEVKRCIENSKYVNPHVMSSTSVEIEWTDEHPLNQSGTMAAAYRDMFAQQVCNDRGERDEYNT